MIECCFDRARSRDLRIEDADNPVDEAFIRSNEEADKLARLYLQFPISTKGAQK